MAADGDEDVDRSVLAVGDEFALQTLPNSSGTVGFVTSHVIDNSLHCGMTRVDVSEFEDARPPGPPRFSRFLLQIAEQYTAAKQLSKFDEALGGTAQGRDYLAAAAEVEGSVNEAELDISKGTTAVFGGIYQLCNSGSGKTMKLSKTMAETDATALRAEFEEEGRRSKAQWFRICPGFRIRNESENVRMGDTVILQSVMMPSMYLNMASTEEGQKEVKCFDTATRFRVVPVSKHTDIAMKEAGRVLGGDYLSIYQRETHTYLHRDSSGRGIMFRMDGAEHDATEAPPPTDRVDLLWQLNLTSMKWSGCVVHEDESVYSLKDAVSQTFLNERPDGTIGFEATDADAGSQWLLRSFENDITEYVVETTYFWLENARTGKRLGRSERMDAAGDELGHFGLIGREQPQEDDLFVFRSVDSTKVKIFLNVTHRFQVVERFLAAINGASDLDTIQQEYLLPDPEIDSDSPWTGPLLRMFEYLLTELIISSETDLLVRDGVINAQLQNLLTEMRVVVFITEELLPQLFQIISAEDIAAGKPGPYLKRLVQYCFLLLGALAKDNNENSVALFNKLEFITAYQGYDFRITSLITEIFVDQESLMRQCDTALIENTWRIAVKAQKNRFLSCLSGLLSNNGSPLKFNQDRLSEIVAASYRKSKANGHSGDFFHIDFKKDDKNLIDFHNELIKVASLLTAGRHRYSIDFFLVEVGISYDRVLQCIMDDSIGYTTRAAYTMLMNSLFVDREPFELYNVVQPSRIMPPLTGTTAEIEKRLGVPPPKAVDPYASFPPTVQRPTPGFTDLKKVVVSVLEEAKCVVAAEIDKNKFLTRIIALSKNLLLFGMFETDAAQPGQKYRDGVLELGAEEIELADKLLSILDVSADRMGSIGLLDRFHEGLVETTTIIEMRKEAVALLECLVGLRASTRIEVLLESLTNQNSEVFEMDGPSKSPSKREGNITPNTLKSIGSDAKKAMDAANKIKVYDMDQTASLQASLLKMLRYNDEAGDLCFAALETLVMFISQRYTFAKHLKKVSILGTDEAAGDYLKAGAEVSEYRRLRKWLHLDKECQECIAVTGSLQTWCTTTLGQNVLRNLNIEEYTTRIMRMRLQSKLFPEVMKTTLKLVGSFCRGNTQNQLIFARHMDQIILKLLWEPQYYAEAALMIKDIVYNNEALSIRFSQMLVQAVSQLTKSPDHGRQLWLLDLLDTLILVESHPVTIAQMQICKGAMVSKELIDTAGDIEEGDWGGGKAMARQDVLRSAIKGGSDSTRCQEAISYYCRSMLVLGTCARGKMPSTELLCAARLPFEEIVSRLQEIQMLDPNRGLNQQGSPGGDIAVAVKNALLSFFREVFVDTNSAQILRMLRQSNNGLWTAKGTDEPIAQQLVEELEKFGSSGVPSASAHRDYLLEQVALFFVQFGCTVGPSQISEAERAEVTAVMSRAGNAAQSAMDKQTWTQREEWILQRLKIVASDFVAGVDPAPFLDGEGIFLEPPAEMAMDANTLAWAAFVDAAVSRDDVRPVRGFKRLVGRGMMDIAMALWNDSAFKNDPADRHVYYTSFIVQPLRHRIRQFRERPPNDTDTIPKLMLVLDIIRAIPYASTCHTDKQKQTSFFRFADAVDLNCSTNPDLASIQAELAKQGWCQICFEILASENLKEMHLCCLHLLLAITGGGNKSVQEVIHEQLMDEKINPAPIFASGFQRLIAGSLRDLKTDRKNAGRPAKHGDEGSVEQIGFAREMLTVLANCVMGHSGMQNYIREQTGRLERHDLIYDVVSYMSQLERDIKVAVQEEFEDGITEPSGRSGKQSQKKNGARKNGPASPAAMTMNGASPKSPGLPSGLGFDNPVHDAAKMAVYDASHSAFEVDTLADSHDFDEDLSVAAPSMTKTKRWPGIPAARNPILLRAVAGFQMLKYCASGPHKINQASIANSDFLAIVNRVLTYSEYQRIEDVNEGGPVLRTATGILHSQVSFCLLALVEGLPNEAIVKRIINGISWSAVHRHLQCLKELIGDGVVSNRWAAQAANHQLRSQPLPPYVANPKLGTQAEWLRREAFRFYSFVSKIKYGGQMQMSRTSGDVLAPMRQLLGDTELTEFFEARVGQAEVVRNGALENLLFWMPDSFFRKDDNAQIARRVKSVLEKAPRDDASEKLAYFLEGANEVVCDIESMTKARLKNGTKIPAFYAWSSRVQPVMYISFLICALCCISLVKESSRRSLDRTTFARWTSTAGFNIGGYEIFLFLAVIHFLTTVIRTYSFLVIRAPVLRKMYTRRGKLAFRANAEDGGGNGTVDHDSFETSSIVVFGLPYMKPNKLMERMQKLNPDAATSMAALFNGGVMTGSFVEGLFKQFGGVSVVRAVPVEPETGADGDWKSTNNSWAVVSFVSPSTVKDVMAKKKKSGGYLRFRALDNCDIDVVPLRMDYINGNVGLEQIAGDAEVELLSKKADTLQGVATSLEAQVSALPLGNFIPVTSFYIFRNDSQVRDCLLDILFSLIGMFWSPLAFTFHMFKLGSTDGAKIVVMSLTHNVKRLMVTILLCLMITWTFSITGWLYFQSYHVESTSLNEGGPCANLLTCFFSYSYAGLMQSDSGIGTYLGGNDFPVSAKDIVGQEFVKTLWEVLFGMISMFVVSIITGIICDTFGELRGDQDEATDYLTTTNFVTGIPFSEIPEEGSSHYLQYTYLMLYLRQRREQDLTPLERMVRDKINDGALDWLPEGRCITSEKKASDEGALSDQLDSLRKDLREELREDLRGDMKEALDSALATFLTTFLEKAKA